MKGGPLGSLPHTGLLLGLVLLAVLLPGGLGFLAGWPTTAAAAAIDPGTPGRRLAPSPPAVFCHRAQKNCQWMVVVRCEKQPIMLFWSFFTVNIVNIRSIELWG